MSDWIDILAEPLSVERAVAFVGDARAGGIDVFLGSTRAERNALGRDLIALDYQAYSEMALKQLHDLANRARAKWPILKLAILHRIGRVPIGSPSVIIAVATPHRAESFDACRFLIDELKRDVALWKKEIWSTGESTWVEGRGERMEDRG